MREKVSGRETFRNVKIDFRTYGKRWKTLLVLCIVIGIIPLVMNWYMLFAQKSNPVSVTPWIIFGIVIMLAFAALGVAVLYKHYHQKSDDKDQVQ